MSFQIGDTVMTTTGKLYLIRSFWTSARHGESATLQPLKPTHRRHVSSSRVDTLTLVRSGQLTLAFNYAAKADRDGAEPWQREAARKLAGHWLTQAELRNDDSRAALCLGSDRILELEAAS
jgi:hypothetical protein